MGNFPRLAPIPSWLLRACPFSYTPLSFPLAPHVCHSRVLLASPKYVNGALRNAELAAAFFPGWVPRFYCGSDVPRAILRQLEELGAELVMMQGSGGTGSSAAPRGNIAGMFWRFLVADDSTVHRFIVRDSDSRLNPRDRLAVS